MNQELPDVQVEFKKGRWTRDQIANICWIIEKAREVQKNIYYYFIDFAKALTVWVTTNWKILQEMGHQSTLLASFETCMQVKMQQLKKKKMQQLELEKEQWTCSKLGKENIKAVYYHLAYLTYMQRTSCEMLGWMKYKLESRLPGELSYLRYADDTTLMAESEEELKSLLMKVKEESEKAGLKLNIKKLRSWSH